MSASDSTRAPKWLCCKKKADLLCLAEKKKEESHDDRSTPIQMVSFPSRDPSFMRALVPSVLVEPWVIPNFANGRSRRTTSKKKTS